VVVLSSFLPAILAERGIGAVSAGMPQKGIRVKAARYPYRYARFVRNEKRDVPDIPRRFKQAHRFAGTLNQAGLG
jgi:hypothetical protein